jgi:hypothetical protein
MEKYGDDRYEFMDKPVVKINSKNGFLLANCYFVQPKKKNKLFVIFDFNYDGLGGISKKILTTIGTALSLNRPVQQYIIDKNDGFYDKESEFTDNQQGGDNSNPFALLMSVFLAPFIVIGFVLTPVAVVTSPIWFFPVYMTNDDFAKYVDDAIYSNQSTKVLRDGTKITKNGFGYIINKTLPDGTNIINDRGGNYIKKILPDGTEVKKELFGEVRYNKDKTLTLIAPNGKETILTEKQFDELKRAKDKISQGIDSVCFIFDIDPVTGIMKNTIGNGNAMNISYAKDNLLYDRINYLEESQKNVDGFFKLNYKTFYKHFREMYPQLPYFPANKEDLEQLKTDKEKCMNKAKKHCEKHYNPDTQKVKSCIRRHTNYNKAVLHCQKHHHHKDTVEKCIKNHTKKQKNFTECSPVPVNDDE